MSADLPVSRPIETYLHKTLIARAHPLLLSFDLHWKLRGTQGDTGFYGLDLGESGCDVRELQELFTGLSLDHDQDIPFVELASGHCAHVHLIVEDGGFQVLLLDADEARTRERAQQQLGNEAALASHQKSWAIGRLKEIRSELERQRESLQEANALKNALIATLSHEFRTPLTSIFGYLHLLEHRSVPDEHSSQALHAIRRNATWLFALAENLLEYGRGNSAPVLINPVEVDLAALLADVDAMFRPLAEDKGLAFHGTIALDDPAPPRFDEGRLRQILINLLSNAVRYTAQGEIAVALTWQAGALSVDVRDSGIGIPLDYRERVFKPFNQGGPSGRKGAGLGLSIVRRLVTQMHGTLTLESSHGGGSHFHIELRSALAATEVDTEAPSPATHRRVLIADDDPDVAHLLEVLLGDLGYHVTSVDNAQAAFDEATRQMPDVLLIDVQLPGLSGNAAVFQLRSRGYRGCIVTLSATASSEARDTALRAGADYYLTKPLNIEQFVGVMQRATCPNWNRSKP